MYYYHLEQLNTPRFVTNSSAQVVWENQADVYGYEEPEFEFEFNKEKTFTQPIRFQGQYLDIESGLHYNRYRYYSPKQQRFINQDPIGLVGGINHYQYAPNPVNWVDPLGLLCKEGQRRVAKAISNNEYISAELRAKLIALSTTSIYTADSMVNAIESGNAADLIKKNELDKAKTTIDDGFNSKQKSIISNLKDKYPNAIPIDVNPEKTNAGKGSPKFHTWLKKDGVVLYDADSNSYIYAIEMDTSLFGRKVVDIEYKADPTNPDMRYPDFTEYSMDEVTLPNGVAIPEDRPKDYGDMYEALDKKHDKQNYSQKKYGVKVLKNGAYSRASGNNPPIKDDDGIQMYTPHHHQNKTDMLMLDFKVHLKFKHVGGVSNANS